MLKNNISLYTFFSLSIYFNTFSFLFFKQLCRGGIISYSFNSINTYSHTDIKLSTCERNILLKQKQKMR